MARRVVLEGKAEKGLTRINVEDHERILQAIKGLADDPFPPGKKTKQLKGHDQLFRRRVGDYRVLYEVTSETITILDILHRRDLERKLRRRKK